MGGPQSILGWGPVMPSENDLLKNKTSKSRVGVAISGGILSLSLSLSNTLHCLPTTAPLSTLLWFCSVLHISPTMCIDVWCDTWGVV